MTTMVLRRKPGCQNTAQFETKEYCGYATTDAEEAQLLFDQWET